MAPNEGEPVADLHAEHVTPYGAWLSFRSTNTTEYGWDAALVWSERRDDVASPEAMERPLGDGQWRELDVFAPVGEPIAEPVILAGLEPATTYYFAVVGLDDGGRPAPGTHSNVVEIQTHPAPSIAANGAHPRVWASPRALDQLAERYSAGDRVFTQLVEQLGPVVVGASAHSDLSSAQHCATAALLWHGTRAAQYRDAALTMIDHLVAIWESESLTGNEYRWADAALGMCADLMWKELSPGERNQVVDALVTTDEANLEFRFDDTDEVASLARTQLITGLLACGAPGVDSRLSERACAVLDAGRRLFYGVQLVKARRNTGTLAQSGGHLPDGTGYAQGTLSYWMQSFHALSNAGQLMDEYAPFVFYALLSNAIHPMTPKRRGLATFGDLDQPTNSEEPNSFSLEHTSPGLFALMAGLLNRWGWADAAGRGRDHVRRTYPEGDDGPAGWAFLLYESDDAPLASQEPLETAWLDSGMGMFYDRTSWEESASFLTFRAGWSGVDHANENAGSFQLYRAGGWATHEALGYDGDSARVAATNAPQLTVHRDGGQSVGQFAQSAAGRAVIALAGSSGDHAFVASDLRGVYTSHYEHSDDYDRVERQLLWLKGEAGGRPDRLVVYDRVDAAAGADVARAGVIQLDAAPTIDGRHAFVAHAAAERPTRLDAYLVLPTSGRLGALLPEGAPNRYPGEIYNHRLTLDPGISERELHLVSALVASDADSTSPAPISVDGDHVVGVAFDDQVALFSRTTAARAATVSAELAVPAAGPRSVYWAGFVPGADYDVSIRRDRAQVTITVAPGGELTADDGGTLLFVLDK